MKLQMDVLGDPLTTHPNQTDSEITIELYPNWQFGCIDIPGSQFGNGSVSTRTPTQSDGPERLLTLVMNIYYISWIAVYNICATVELQ